MKLDRNEYYLALMRPWRRAGVVAADGMLILDSPESVDVRGIGVVSSGCAAVSAPPKEQGAPLNLIPLVLDDELARDERSQSVEQLGRERLRASNPFRLAQEVQRRLQIRLAKRRHDSSKKIRRSSYGRKRAGAARLAAQPQSVEGGLSWTCSGG